MANPVFIAGDVSSNGQAFALTFSANMLPPAGGSGFTLRVAGQVFNPVSVVTSANIITLSTLLTAYQGEEVTIEYAPGNITDDQDAILQAFGPVLLDNQSDQEPVIPDNSPPAVDSVVVAADGLFVAVNLSELHSLPVRPVGAHGFSLHVNGVARNFEIGRTAVNQYTLSLLIVIYAGDTVTLDYAQSPNGDVSDNVGNALDSFTGRAATNGSAVVRPVNSRPSSPGILPAAGTYASAITVTISADAGAAIYYTVRVANIPSRVRRYTAPFVVAKSAVVRAVAVHNGRVSRVAASAFRFARLGLAA